MCGSRTFEDQPIVWGTLDGLLARTLNVLVVIHGAAQGADALAAMWVEREGSSWVAAEAYPAKWSLFGKAAGPIRNQQMLVEGEPDVALAFVDKPLAESRGTHDMVTRARKAGIPVYVIERM